MQSSAPSVMMILLFSIMSFSVVYFEQKQTKVTEEIIFNHGIHHYAEGEVYMKGLMILNWFSMVWPCCRSSLYSVSQPASIADDRIAESKYENP